MPVFSSIRYEHPKVEQLKAPVKPRMETFTELSDGKKYRKIRRERISEMSAGKTIGSDLCPKRTMIARESWDAVNSPHQIQQTWQPNLAVKSKQVRAQQPFSIAVHPISVVQIVAKLMLDDSFGGFVGDVGMDKNPYSRETDSTTGQDQSGSEHSDSFQLFNIIYSFDQDPIFNIRLNTQSDFMPIPK